MNPSSHSVFPSFLSDHFFYVEQTLMLRMPRFPQASVECYVVVADLEVFASGDNVGLPANPVDDQPVADAFALSIYRLKCKPLKHVQRVMEKVK